MTISTEQRHEPPVVSAGVSRERSGAALYAAENAAPDLCLKNDVPRADWPVRSDSFAMRTLNPDWVFPGRFPSKIMNLN